MMLLQNYKSDAALGLTSGTSSDSRSPQTYALLSNCRAETSGGAGWGAWGTLPGQELLSFTVGPNNDGRLEVAGLNTDFSPCHIWQTQPNNNGWSAWEGLGQGYSLANSGLVVDVLVLPACSLDPSFGMLEVYVVGVDRALWHSWQSSAVPSGWTQWSSLVGKLAASANVATVSSQAGVVQVC